MNLYEPIFNLACVECDAEPVVGIRDDEGILRATHLCGLHFFGCRAMSDWELWNEPQEATE